MIAPERAILADRDALQRANRRLADIDLHPLARAAHEADARYLRKLIDRYERFHFQAHGLA